MSEVLYGMPQIPLSPVATLKGEQTGARQGSGGEAGARAGAAPSHCHVNRAAGQVARGEAKGAPGSQGKPDTATRAGAGPPRQNQGPGEPEAQSCTERHAGWQRREGEEKIWSEELVVKL